MAIWRRADKDFDRGLRIGRSREFVAGRKKFGRSLGRRSLWIQDHSTRRKIDDSKTSLYAKTQDPRPQSLVGRFEVLTKDELVWACVADFGPNLDYVKEFFFVKSIEVIW